MPRRFLIDTDGGSDDVVALIMALRHPDVEVAAITVVSGNVPVEQAARNVLVTLELCEADVPVFAGAGRPLEREPAYAYWFHGRDGLGDVGYRTDRRPSAGSAVDAIVEAAAADPGLTLVTLGPLTNLALALGREPGLATAVDRCVVMGGAACTVGNVTPAAEFNIWVDPEAARRVFHSGLPIEMVGWELCRGDANLDDDEMAYVRGFDSPLADFTLDSNRTAILANRRQSGDPGLSLPDPVAMAIAIDPKICRRRGLHYVDVETAGRLTRGMTVVDRLDVTHDERNRDLWSEIRQREPNVTVCWEIDVPAWKESLYRSLRR